MRVFFFAFALLLAGCATYPSVHTDFDPAADFANYRSYSWAPLKVPAGMNPLLIGRVQASIDRSLAARGYQQSAASDFIIDFTVLEKTGPKSMTTTGLIMAGVGAAGAGDQAGDQRTLP